MRQLSSHGRDAALRRLSHANRWLIAGSIALTGALTEVAANAFPGKTLRKGTSGSRTPARSGASSSTRTAPESLQPPASPPEDGSPESDGGSSGGEGDSAQTPPASEAQPEAAPSGEAQQSQQQAPTQESAPPVVSGGS
jgi:hypothetical protein